MQHIVDECPTLRAKRAENKDVVGPVLLMFSVYSDKTLVGARMSAYTVQVRGLLQLW